MLRAVISVNTPLHRLLSTMRATHSQVMPTIPHFPPPVNRFLQKNPVFFAVSSHFLLLPAVILCMIEPI